MRLDGPLGLKRVENQTSEFANELKIGGEEEAGNVAEHIEACRCGIAEQSPLKWFATP